MRVRKTVYFMSFFNPKYSSLSQKLVAVAALLPRYNVSLEIMKEIISLIIET